MITLMRRVLSSDCSDYTLKFWKWSSGVQEFGKGFGGKNPPKKKGGGANRVKPGFPWEGPIRGKPPGGGKKWG